MIADFGSISNDCSCYVVRKDCDVVLLSVTRLYTYRFPLRERVPFASLTVIRDSAGLMTTLAAVPFSHELTAFVEGGGF